MSMQFLCLQDSIDSGFMILAAQINTIVIAEEFRPFKHLQRWGDNLGDEGGLGLSRDDRENRSDGSGNMTCQFAPQTSRAVCCF